MNDPEARSDHHRMLLERRYGGQVKPANIIWNEVVERQLAHRSVRTFLPEALPDGALETMVAAAQSASTSSALQLWSLVAVTDPALKLALAETIARTVPTDRIPWIEEAPALLLWIADASRSAATVRARGAEPVVLEHLDSFLMASIDTALAAQNAVVAAESVGLGAVFLGVMRNAAEQVAKLIGLPAHSFVAFGMAVGRPDPQRVPNVRPRLAQPAVLHLNGYNHDGYRDLLDDYERAYLAFREAGNMRPKSWQDSVHEAGTSMAYMGGREHLRETVTNRGFTLR